MFQNVLGITGTKYLCSNMSKELACENKFKCPKALIAVKSSFLWESVVQECCPQQNSLLAGTLGQKGRLRSWLDMLHCPDHKSHINTGILAPTVLI